MEGISLERITQADALCGGSGQAVTTIALIFVKGNLAKTERVVHDQHSIYTYKPQL